MIIHQHAHALHVMMCALGPLGNLRDSLLGLKDGFHFSQSGAGNYLSFINSFDTVILEADC
jgi:hypothetical protein